MQLLEGVPLGRLTTLGVGGAARWFVEARSEEEVREALDWWREQPIPLFVLGGGSNLVVSDKGWPGLVLHVAIRGISERTDGHTRTFDCGAGEDWDALVAHSVNLDCAGLECLSGIPGTVGGTPVQNVGAYGQDVSETIINVRAVEIETGEPVEFSNAQCGFTYRTSRFNTADRGKYVITGGTFALRRGGAPKLEYADLKRYFAEWKGVPSLLEVRQAVLRIRAAKGMVLDENDSESRSAGSFFKNPVVGAAQYEHVSAIAGQSGLTVPKFPAVDGHVKIPAAWLIEQAGLQKGFELGPVSISRKHTLALVNRGGATAQDVIAMKDLVQKKVRDSFGVELQPEPVFVGFDM